MAELQLQPAGSPATRYAQEMDRRDTSDLVRRCCIALDIAQATLTLLAEDGYNDPDDTSIRIFPEKIVGETGLLLLVMSMVGAHKQIADRVETLALALIPRARKQKTFLDICLQPALALEYAQAHIFLTNIGYPDHNFDALLLKCINADAHAGRERTPHRMLEQVWVKTLWHNQITDKRHVDNIVANSALNKPIDLLHGTKDDMYAFTHALMYATAFSSSQNKMPREITAITDEAEAMLARCLDEKDYDLAGEILLTWPLTGSNWSAAATFAFNLLAAAEDETGYLPSPGTKQETLDKLEGIIREKYFYATIYHTAYVMGLLCAVSLQPGDTPPANIKTKLQPPGSAIKILPYLKDGQKTRQWRAAFNKLTTVEQDALSGLLLNMAMVRQVRQKQYGAVYELLIIACEMDMAGTPVARQAAELLDRLAMIGSKNS